MKYFVEKLPNGCHDCNCCHTKDYDLTKQIDAEKFCGIEDIDVTDRYSGFEWPERPDWCPLREIPKKKEKRPADMDNGCSMRDFKNGWNACIDEMIGE